MLLIMHNGSVLNPLLPEDWLIYTCEMWRRYVLGILIPSLQCFFFHQTTGKNTNPKVDNSKTFVVEHYWHNFARRKKKKP